MLSWLVQGLRRANHDNFCNLKKNVKTNYKTFNTFISPKTNVYGIKHFYQVPDADLLCHSNGFTGRKFSFCCERSLRCFVHYVEISQLVLEDSQLVIFFFAIGKSLSYHKFVLALCLKFCNFFVILISRLLQDYSLHNKKKNERKKS